MKKVEQRDHPLAEDPTYRFYHMISTRLSDAFASSNMTQQQLADRVAGMGLTITQSAISKIMNYTASPSSKRAPALPMIHVVYLCRALGLKLEDVVENGSGPLEAHSAIPSQLDPEYAENSRTLVFDPSQPEFAGYLTLDPKEPFHCYFYPTISSEHTMLHGELTFLENKARRRCDATLALKVMQQLDENKEPIRKRYTGTLIVSVPQRSCYCILSNMEYGEICMINFHHRYFLTKHSLQCRLACAITTSAGENRRPTIHRMLITKNELSEEDLRILKPQLRLNSKRITVPKEDLDRLIDEEVLPAAVADRFKDEKIAAPKEYYSFDESQIQSLEIDFMDRVKAIAQLREASTDLCYNKSSSKADDLIFKYLNQVSKAT